MRFFSSVATDHPSVGIFTSFSGFGASLWSFLAHANVLLGFAGAVLGLCAGYFTLRVKYAEWKKISKQ